MKTLELKFAKTLNIKDSDCLSRSLGPYFNSWLPDGYNDRLARELKHGEISIWFERRAKREESGEYKYSSDAPTFDPINFTKQDLFDGGPLFGEIKITNCSESLSNDLNNLKFDSEEVVNFAKSTAIQISNFTAPIVEILRSHYGQFWLRPFSVFNPSETKSGYIGNYHRGIQTQYKNDKGDWVDFRPHDGHLNLTLQLSSFDGYLSEKDWSELKTLVHNRFEPETTAYLLSSLNERVYNDDYEGCIFELITALEISLKSFLKNRILIDQEDKAFKSFSSLNLPHKITLASALSNFTDKEDIQNSIDLIKIRNDYAHEGKLTDYELNNKIKSTVKLINHFTDGPDFRLLSASPGNRYSNTNKA